VDFNTSVIELPAATLEPGVMCHICYVMGICCVDLTEKYSMLYLAVHTRRSWILILFGDLFFLCFFMEVSYVYH
jgi:hypothetical protein